MKTEGKVSNPAPPPIEDLAREVSLRAKGRPIGKLQEKRAAEKRLTIVPQFIDGRTIFDKYAYHTGGRNELQFNIAFEDGRNSFRHGVAFGLQPSKYSLDIGVFEDRIRNFNEFLDDNPKAYDHLSMWYFKDDKRSASYTPKRISDSLKSMRPFIVLGAMYPTGDINVDSILDDFDRLMPLWEYVEGYGTSPHRKHRSGGRFDWRPGNNARVPRSTYARPDLSGEFVLRHNQLQASLFEHLESVYGGENVSGEQDCGIGKYVDIAVRDGSNYMYFEVKTGLSARSCIREAFGQLMEYAFWPGAQKAHQLFVIGEPPLDQSAAKYIEVLEKKFGLPIAYKQYDLQRGRLI